jgi:hypothetical protein
MKTPQNDLQADQNPPSRIGHAANASNPILGTSTCAPKSFAQDTSALPLPSCDGAREC